MDGKRSEGGREECGERSGGSEWLRVGNLGLLQTYHAEKKDIFTRPQNMCSPRGRRDAVRSAKKVGVIQGRFLSFGSPLERRENVSVTCRRRRRRMDEWNML